MNDLLPIIVLSVALYFFIQRPIKHEIQTFHKKYRSKNESLTVQDLWNDLDKNSHKIDEGKAEKAERSIEKQLDLSREFVTSALKEMNQNVIYISSGALSLATTLFLSEAFHHLLQKSFFGISYVFFGLSIALAFISYLYRTNSHGDILNSYNEKEKFSEILDEMQRLKYPLDEEKKKELKEGLNNSWEGFKDCVRMSRKDEALASCYFEFSIACLFAGLFFFFVFGLYNIN